MIAFLAPLALLGLSLLGIPIVLHLFKPRKVREIPFSSLRWLRDSTQRLSKRFQWHQILLFLLRVGLITCLALAVARPVVSRRDGGRFRDRFVVLDLGRGMDYRVAGRPAPIESARRIALDVLQAAGQGDRMTVIPGEPVPTAWGGLTEDADRYRDAVRQAQPGRHPGTISAAFNEIARLSDSLRDDTALDITVLSDFRYSGWSFRDVAEFRRRVGDRPVALTIVDVGPVAPVNAWIAGARLIEDREGRLTIRTRLGVAGSDHEERRLRLTGLPGLPDHVEDVVLRADRRTTVDIPLPAGYPADRAVARLQIEPPDAMPEDDVYWLNLDQRAGLRLLVVEPRVSAVETLQPGFHLRTALAAISEAERHSVRIERRTPDDLRPDDLTAAHAIFLVDVPELPPALATALEQQVRAGAGMAVFFGPSVRPAFYNTQWVTSGGRGVMPVSLDEPIAFDGNDATPGRLTGLNAGHALLSGLVDPHVGDLGQVAIRTAFAVRMDELATDQTAIPAWIDDQTPAILVHAVDAGQTVWFNLSADDRWTDLPRRSVFVPLIDRLLTLLTGGLVRRTFAAGETVRVPAPDRWAVESLRVTTPDGRHLIPQRRLMGGRTVLQIDQTDQIGVYRIHPADLDPGEDGIPFVVQASRQDSLARRMDDAVLRGWLPDTDIRIVRPDPATGRVDDFLTRRSRVLAPWLILLAALFFMAEMFFVHWFCPRLGVVWKPEPALDRRDNS